MSLHRSGKTRWPHINEDFYCFCKGKSYNVQVTEVPSGNFHDENSILDKK